VPPFGHVLKVARADEHLQTLAAEIHWWVGSDPYRITEEIDPETNNRTLSAERFGNPPLKLSLVIGDVVHNLRSGLDHLALALAEANMGTATPPEVEELSQFPFAVPETNSRTGGAAGSDAHIQKPRQRSSDCSRIDVATRGSNTPSGSSGNFPTSRG